MEHNPMEHISATGTGEGFSTEEGLLRLATLTQRSLRGEAVKAEIGALKEVLREQGIEESKLKNAEAEGKKMEFGDMDRGRFPHGITAFDRKRNEMGG